MRPRNLVSHELEDPIIEDFEMAWLDRMTLSKNDRLSGEL